MYTCKYIYIYIQGLYKCVGELGEKPEDDIEN